MERSESPGPPRFPRRALAALLGCALALAGGSASGAVPEWSAAASLLLPGAGQMANGEWSAGGAQMGLAFVLARQAQILQLSPDYLESDQRTDNANMLVHVNRTSYEADLYNGALLNLSFYSSFAVYRDARAAMGNQGYSTPLPREGLADLAAAPFQWEHLRRATTWAPLLVVLYLAAEPPTAQRYLYQPEGSLSRDDLRAGAFFQDGMVAVGEETFFRGVLNTGLSDSLGEGWGLVSSSALFGLAHQGSPGQATIAGASLFGLYLGLLQQENDYRLGQGVAIHFWWDFLVTLGMLQERKPGQAVQLLRVSIPF